MINKRGEINLIKLLVIMILIGALGFAGWKFYSDYQGGSKARLVMSSLEQIIPDLGVDTGVVTGIGSEQLSAVSIEGIDIVGVLEIPALNINAPVTSKAYTEEYFASLLGGSPVQKNFQLIGNRDDLFRKLSKLKPGDRVSFTDIDGIRYNYEVMTQYHLKKWDEGDNDLLLCYKTNGDTYFVVGCSAAITE